MNRRTTNILLHLTIGLALCAPLARAQTIVEHTLTVAANPALAASDAEIDAILAEMNRVMAMKAFPFDTPCPDVRFRRSGNVIVNPDLLPIGTFDELVGSMRRAAPTANVLMVMGIDCSGVTAAGCGNVGSEPLVVGQAPGFEAQLWLHERGHNVGLQHAADPPTVDTSVQPEIGMRFMFWQLGVGHLAKTADECHHFEAAALSSVSRVQAPTVLAAAAPNGALPDAPPETLGTSAGGTVEATGAPSDPVAAAVEAGRQAGLTDAAFKAVGPPWMHGAPLETLKALGPADLDSIRALFAKPPNQFWPAAIQVLAIVGDANDATLLRRALDLPLPAVPPGASPGSLQQFRTLLQTKLVAPRALGILANRTQSNVAVESLTHAADLGHATELVGAPTAETLSRRAIDGLAIANSTAGNAFVNATTGAQLPAVASGVPSPDSGGAGVKVAPMSDSDRQRLRDTQEQVRSHGVESFLK